MIKANGDEGITPSQTALALMGAAAFECDGDALTFAAPFIAAGLLGAPTSQLPQTLTRFLALLPEDARRERAQALQSLTWDGASYKCCYALRRFDDVLCWIEECGRRIGGEGKRAVKLYGVLRDVSEARISEQKAALSAQFDELTGLWHGERLREGLKDLMAQAELHAAPAALFGFELTNLDDVNLTYGHEAADRVLSELARRLRAALPAPHFGGRLSGRCFIAGCHKLSGDALNQSASALLERLGAPPIATPYGVIAPQLACAGVPISGRAIGTPALLGQLERALSASRAKDGVYTPFTPALPEIRLASKREDFTPDSILTALNERRITLAYQPIVHARTRKAHHFECLLRLKRDDGEIVPAGDFIEAAERLGLVHLLDRRALELASQTLRAVPGVPLALNISAATIKDESAAQDYLATLKTLGPLCARVIVEMTETVAVDDPARASRFSNAARALGATFSIDDFGAGYTTFQNLMAIEADEIKIDGSFIRDLALTPHKQVFVRIMVDLAQTFNVKTVAEFVNTREDADLLTRFGVDYLQGYMFGAPSTSPDWTLFDKSALDNVMPLRGRAG